MKLVPHITAMLLASAVLLNVSEAVAGSPNIVLILTDDQGWNNTSTPMIPGRDETRSDYYQTPNIDRMAEAGMVFSDGYAPAAICSPSRHSIQFGISPGRLHKPTNRGRNYPEPFETAAIPQVLKQIDPAYRAAHFGKWHMFQPPAELGYDQSDGRTDNRTGGFSTTDQRRFWAKEDPKRMDQITDASVEFMKRQADAGHPFYLQISHYAIHLNAEARQESLDEHQARTPGDVHTAYWYAAMIDDLDAAVGRVLDAVDELGLQENTYIFFTSDNGGLARQFPGFNEPLRAGKGSFYEGGLRVPFIVAGPGIDPASSSDVPVIGWDFLPTFADLAGGSPEQLPERVEGGSLRPVLLGGGSGQIERPRDGLFFFRRRGAVVRKGQYKLKRATTAPQWELFDLAEDLSETKNLADEQPERTAALKADLEAWIEEADVGAGPQRRRRARLARQPAEPVKLDLHQGQTLLLGDAPQVDGLTIELTATVEPESSDGVIFAHGGSVNGYALYLKDGKPAFALRMAGQIHETVGDTPLPQNEPTKLTATLAGDGTISIRFGGRTRASSPTPGPLNTSPRGQLNVGWDYQSPVADYSPRATPNRFAGRITEVTLQTRRPGGKQE